MNQQYNKPAAQKMIECELVKDTWDANEVRVKSGTRVKLTAEQALEAIESGSYRRVKEG